MRLEAILPAIVDDARQLVRRVRRRVAMQVDPVTGYAVGEAARGVAAASAASEVLVAVRVIDRGETAVRTVARQLRAAARPGRLARFDCGDAVILVAVVDVAMAEQVSRRLGHGGAGAEPAVPAHLVVRRVGVGAGAGAGAGCAAAPGLTALERCVAELCPVGTGAGHS